MTCQRFHTVSRMRENCTYGSMRGRTYPAGASRPTLHSRDIRLRARRGNESCELYRDGDARAYRHDYEERDGDLGYGGK